MVKNLTQKILAAHLQEGIFRIFNEAGPVKRNWSVCGPCVGMGDSPPEGVLSVRTFNRNFPGRSGTPYEDGKCGRPIRVLYQAEAVVVETTDPRKKSERLYLKLLSY